MRKTVVLLLLLLGFTSALNASEYEEEAKERQFINCLVERRVNPSSISKADNEFCLNEVGIEGAGVEIEESNLKQWHRCVAEKAFKFDDDISPVGDIARAILPMCSKELEVYVNSRAVVGSVKRKIVKDREFGFDVGVQSVLAIRKMKKESALSEQSKNKSIKPSRP